MKRILFVASEPKNIPTTECSAEYKVLNYEWKNSRLKDEYAVIFQEDLTSDELIDSIKKIAPEYIHYCGHGNADGELQVQYSDGVAHRLKSDLLVKFLRRNQRLECIVFCSCNSEDIVEEVKAVCNYAIGFRGNVHNSDMHRFTAEFYNELFEVGSPLHAYLNTIDRIRARIQQGNILIFRTKLNYVMESVLKKELSIAQAKALAAEEEMNLSDQLLSIAERDIEELSGAYSDDFFEVMKTHPAPSEVIWFSSNKDALAAEVAARLYRGRDQQEIDDFIEEIKLLYFAFETVLVYYENEDVAVENFKNAIGEYPISDYIGALSELRHVQFTVFKSKDFEVLYEKSINYSISIVSKLIS